MLTPGVAIEGDANLAWHSAGAFEIGVAGEILLLWIGVGWEA